MDYKGIAEQILKDVGGPENIASYAHCATRLRLVLVDETKADKKAVEKIEAVAGSFTAGGQYQIILGPGHGQQGARRAGRDDPHQGSQHGGGQEGGRREDEPGAARGQDCSRTSSCR